MDNTPLPSTIPKVLRGSLTHVLAFEAPEALRYLQTAQEGSLALETTNLPATHFPHLEALDWTTGSLYSAIENVYKYRIDRGEERIGAVKAGHEEAHLLKVDVGFPLLSIRNLVCDANGMPVEYGLSLYRADRYVARILTFRRHI